MSSDENDKKEKDIKIETTKNEDIKIIKKEEKTKIFYQEKIDFWEDHFFNSNKFHHVPISEMIYNSNYFYFHLAAINLLCGIIFGYGTGISGVVVANSKIYFTNTFSNETSEIKKSVLGNFSFS
jgi:hypothetical protein